MCIVHLEIQSSELIFEKKSQTVLSSLIWLQLVTIWLYSPNIDHTYTYTFSIYKYLEWYLESMCVIFLYTLIFLHSLNFFQFVEDLKYTKTKSNVQSDY